MKHLIFFLLFATVQGIYAQPIPEFDTVVMQGYFIEHYPGIKRNDVNDVMPNYYFIASQKPPRRSVVSKCIRAQSDSIYLCNSNSEVRNTNILLHTNIVASDKCSNYIDGFKHNTIHIRKIGRVLVYNVKATWLHFKTSTKNVHTIADGRINNRTEEMDVFIYCSGGN